MTDKRIEADAVDTEKQELIEVLRFYGDKENYRPSQNLRTALLQRYMSIVEFDDGQRAREVLEKHGGGDEV